MIIDYILSQIPFEVFKIIFSLILGLIIGRVLLNLGSESVDRIKNKEFKESFRVFLYILLTLIFYAIFNILSRMGLYF